MSSRAARPWPWFDVLPLEQKSNGALYAIHKHKKDPRHEAATHMLLHRIKSRKRKYRIAS
jgi:hypothetical protein